MTNLLICIPTNGRPKEIKSLMHDLNNQKDKNFSIVILNDGSSQETQHALNTLNTNFTLYTFKTPKKSGLPAARNKILNYIDDNQLAKPKTFVAFLDDDLIIKDDFTAQVQKYSKLFDGFCFRLIQRGESTTFDFTQSKLLQFIFTPLVGKVIPFFGVFFAGFYIKINTIKKIDHLNGGCLIYNYSKNKNERFDLNLNEGNFVAEDTCFSYGLKKHGNDLRFISDYSYIHNPPKTGGCKIKDKKKSFYWYWKHKIYIFRKFSNPITSSFSIFFSFIESILLSIIFRTNLISYFFSSVKDQPSL